MRIQYFVGQVMKRQTGGEIYHAELMRFLARKNEIVDEAKVAVANRGNMLSANWWCWQRMRKCQAEIIVEDSYYAPCLFMSNWLARMWRPRIVVFVQEVLEAYTRWSPWRYAVRWAIRTVFLRSADLVIANSHYTRNQIILRYPVRPEKIIVLSPTGQKLPGAGSPPIRTKSKVKKLLCASSIRPEKGQKFLLEVMHLLNQPDYHLTLVGDVKDPAYYNEVRNLIVQYGLQGRIHFAGFLEGEALANEYREADIYVHPSLAEEYGMVLVEAMGWGLPIVASREGATPEIVGHSRTCILVKSGNPLELAQAIKHLLADDSLCAKLGAAAFARAQSFPTWEEVGHKFQQLLYRQLKGM